MDPRAAIMKQTCDEVLNELGLHNDPKFKLATALEKLDLLVAIDIYPSATAAMADYTQYGVPAEAPSIEGYLFPATYTFDPGVSAHDVIQRMVDDEAVEVIDASIFPDSGS